MSDTAICFDSLSPRYKSPLGPAQVGEPIHFSVRLPLESGASHPRLLLFSPEQWETPRSILPMTLSERYPTECWYTVELSLTFPQLLFYRFDVEQGEGRVPLLRTPDGFSGGLQGTGECWQLSVFSPLPQSPALTGGLLYQIFPDRFCNSHTPKREVPADRMLREDWGELPQFRPDETGEYRCNDYFGGDLRGMIEKLPYLASLGVTALYLNPIFLAHSNHRYNTADYRRIDPLLGEEADLIDLCAAARKLGMIVLLDGVFSHTGSDSIYFNKEGRYQGGAYRDPNSPYADWYQFHHFPDDYKSWWGFSTLPEVQEENPAFLDFIAGTGGVIDHWMDCGVGGWRLDVADELPDAALDAIGSAVRRHDPTAPLIGEVWENASNKESYGVQRRYLLGQQLSSVMNYPLTQAILGFVREGAADALRRVLLTQQEEYPAPIRHQLMNALATHDIPRAITALVGESAEGKDREWQAAHQSLSPEAFSQGVTAVQRASLLQYFLPGTPCLYYGEEAGMIGYRDPFNRGCYPWGKENPTLLAWFAHLGQLRHAERDILANGECFVVESGPSVFSFLRSGKTAELFVAVRRDEASPQLPAEWNPETTACLLKAPGMAVYRRMCSFG